MIPSETTAVSRQMSVANELGHGNVLGFLDDEGESEQKIKEAPLQKMGLVYMTEKWETGSTYSSEEQASSVTKTNFDKAKEEHNKSYKRLMKEK